MFITMEAKHVLLRRIYFHRTFQDDACGKDNNTLSSVTFYCRSQMTVRHRFHREELLWLSHLEACQGLR